MESNGMSEVTMCVGLLFALLVQVICGKKSQNPECWRAHAGELLIFDVMGGITFVSGAVRVLAGQWQVANPAATDWQL